jgi:hypothetical protein
MFVKPFNLECKQNLKKFCLLYLHANWDFKTEKIFRLNLDLPLIEEINQELLEKNLPTVEAASIFCRGPFHNQGIHIDTAKHWAISYATIYFPIVGAQGSKITWFDPDNGREYKVIVQYVNSNGQESTSLQKHYNNPNLHIVESRELMDLCIINTQIPHRAESGLHSRAALAIKLKENPDLMNMDF